MPEAIDFLASHDWGAVQRRCRALAERATREVAELVGMEPLAGPFGQMAGCPLPPCDSEVVQRTLFDEHRVEVLVREWEGRPILRVSFQGDNDEGDLARLLTALPRAF